MRTCFELKSQSLVLCVLLVSIAGCTNQECASLQKFAKPPDSNNFYMEIQFEISIEPSRGKKFERGMQLFSCVEDIYKNDSSYWLRKASIIFDGATKDSGVCEKVSLLPRCRKEISLLSASAEKSYELNPDPRKLAFLAHMSEHAHLHEKKRAYLKKLKAEFPDYIPTTQQ